MPEILPSGFGLGSVFFQAINSKFSQAFLNAKTIYDQEPGLALIEQSSSFTTVYGFLDRIPALRPWNAGPRVRNPMSLRAQTITNQRYEDTLAMDADIINDIQGGINYYSGAISLLGAAAKRQIDILLAAYLKGPATTANVYDGVPYFSASHPVNMDNTALGTQSNLYTSGKALNAANFATVYANMKTILGADGKPFGISNNLVLMHPPALREQAKSLMEDEWFTAATAWGQVSNAGPSQNTLKGVARILENPYISAAYTGVSADDTMWYLFDVGQVAPPLIYQQREAPILVPKSTQPSDQEYFDDNLVVYGLKMRGAAGPGLWQFAVQAQS